MEANGAAAKADRFMPTTWPRTILLELERAGCQSAGDGHRQLEHLFGASYGRRQQDIWRGHIPLGAYQGGLSSGSSAPAPACAGTSEQNYTDLPLGAGLFCSCAMTWESAMDQFEFVHSQNIKRYQNLLETSVDEVERQTIQKLLAKKETKQAFQASLPKLEKAAAGERSETDHLTKTP